MVNLPIVLAYLAAGVVVLPVVEYLKRRVFPFDANFNKTIQFGYDRVKFPDGKPLAYKVADNLANLIAYLFVLPVWPVFVVMLVFRFLRGEG